MEDTAHINIIENQRKIAGVRFRENWKVYDFDANGIELTVGDRVVVDSERGPGFARVVRIRKTAESDEPIAAAPPLEEIAEGVEMDIEEADKKPSAEAAPRSNAPKGSRKILRKATADDIAREEKNRVRESDAFMVAQDLIAERDLPMKLIRVEYSFDAARATFYFFSETRIDFRDLVKDLAFKLKSRIEMRQIGVRDVARMIGGFGPCGRELCCSSFLKNFEPVSIRMAKKQDMVLNPAKISGVCGRLLCCLSYEYGMYDEIKKDVADMKEAAFREKRDVADRRISEERREADERRILEDKKRNEDRRQQPEPRQDKQKEAGAKDPGRQEKKRSSQDKNRRERSLQEKKTQPRPDHAAKPQQQKPQPQSQQKQEVPQIQNQKAQQPQSEGEKQGKKKKRRFWRRKKKGGQQQGGENRPPQGNGGPPAATE